MDYMKYITRDPRVCGGQPVIAGTRVPLRTVLASLAEGDTPQEIVCDFPTLTEDAVHAVIAFAATVAEEDLPILGVPASFIGTDIEVVAFPVGEQASHSYVVSDLAGKLVWSGDAVKEQRRLRDEW